MWFNGWSVIAPVPGHYSPFTCDCSKEFAFPIGVVIRLLGLPYKFMYPFVYCQIFLKFICVSNNWITASAFYG